MKILFYLLPALVFGHLQVHEHGYWEGDEITECYFDQSLGKSLLDFFQAEGAKNVVDFGCCTGDYIRVLIKAGIDCEGYDGNPEIPRLSDGLVRVIDLSHPFDLGKRFDWVMSLEVGEHLPKDYEQVFIENLHRHNVNGIILSWAVPGQGGLGHYNEQSNEYIKSVMEKLGYVNDREAENQLRKTASLWWFKNTIMVFRKPTKTSH